MVIGRGFLIVMLLAVNPISASDIFVDNIIGRDADDGSTTHSSDGRSGPVYSIQRALQLAGFGDVIVLAKTGRPYYESLSLTGDRHSGTRFRPFIIQGNGATISGLRSLPQGSWQKAGSKLWKVTLTRKGHYRLLRNGRSLPEFKAEGGEDPLSKLSPGEWTAWGGSLYFLQDGVDPPESQAFAYSAEQTGISLHHVSNVLITDVTLQHFRFDGIHAQGLCDGIILDNVNSFENGRAGIVSSGASRIELYGGKIAGNSHHQLLVLDHSTAIPDGCEIE